MATPFFFPSSSSSTNLRIRFVRTLPRGHCRLCLCLFLAPALPAIEPINSIQPSARPFAESCQSRCVVRSLMVPDVFFFFLANDRPSWSFHRRLMIMIIVNVFVPLGPTSVLPLHAAECYIRTCSDMSQSVLGLGLTAVQNSHHDTRTSLGSPTATCPSAAFCAQPPAPSPIRSCPEFVLPRRRRVTALSQCRQPPAERMR